MLGSDRQTGWLCHAGCLGTTRSDCRKGKVVQAFKDIFLLWRGRISRKTYWICGFLPPIVMSVIGLALCSSPTRDCLRLDLPVWLTLTVLSVTTYIGLMLSIKRSHDLGYTGVFALVLFVPLLNLWPLVTFGFFNGTEGENKYGPPDRRFPNVCVDE